MPVAKIIFANHRKIWEGAAYVHHRSTRQYLITKSDAFTCVCFILICDAQPPVVCLCLFVLVWQWFPEKAAGCLIILFRTDVYKHVMAISMLPSLMCSVMIYGSILWSTFSEKVRGEDGSRTNCVQSLVWQVSHRLTPEHTMLWAKRTGKYSVVCILSRSCAEIYDICYTYTQWRCQVDFVPPYKGWVSRRYQYIETAMSERICCKSSDRSVLGWEGWRELARMSWSRRRAADKLALLLIVSGLLLFIIVSAKCCIIAADEFQVMRKYHTSWRQGLYQVRSHFSGGVPLYETFVSQLRVWQGCSYDLYEIRHGRLRPKRLYRDWIERAVRRDARAPVQRYCAQSWRSSFITDVSWDLMSIIPILFVGVCPGTGEG